MRAIILAAGRGSRMKEMTEEIPKCLVRHQGRTLLDWQLEGLRSAGIDEIGIVTGYRREALEPFGLTEFHNPRWAETNMVSSLAEAHDWLADGPCIVSYSDIFYQSSAVQSLLASPASIAVTYDVNWLDLWTKRFGDPLSDAETFRLDADGFLTEIGGRATSVDQIQGQYMGLLRFTPAGWAEVMRLRSQLSVKDADRMHMTGTLQQVITAGRLRLAAIPYAGQWGEVDSQSDLAVYT